MAVAAVAVVVVVIVIVGHDLDCPMNVVVVE